jgi:hypothetical protein
MEWRSSSRNMANSDAPAEARLRSNDNSGQARVLALAGGAWLALPLSALGFLIVGLSDDATRHSSTVLSTWYWVGMALLFSSPVVAVLGTQRLDRWLCGMVTVTTSALLYCVNILESPTQFVLQDEFGWIRTVNSTIATGHLYQSNPLVPDYAWYPGLTAITVDFHELSGMSVFGSAAIIVGVIKVWGAVALLGIFVKTMGDWRYATLATLLYFANPSYMQFDSQFFYESVALSLMFVIIWILLIAVDKADSINVVLPGLLCTCLTITHHLTAYCLVLLLAGCVFAGRLRGKRRYDDTTRRREDQMGPVLVCLGWLIVAIGAWLAVRAGSTTISEIGPPVKQAVDAFYGLVTGRVAPRHLFAGSGGITYAGWLQLTSYGAVLALLLGLVCGIIKVGLRSGKGVTPLGAVLVAVAVTYPLSLAFRFTASGAESSARASAYVFLGLSYVICWGLMGEVRSWPSHSARRRLGKHALAAVAAPLAAVICIGGLVVEAGPYTLQPGAFLGGSRAEVDRRSGSSQR